MFVATRILIISPQLNFTIAIKKALEALGGFEVSVTTNGQTGIEQAQRMSFNVAIIDATTNDIPVADLVLRLRAKQPQLAFLLGPQTSTIEQLVRDLNLQGVVPIPTTARVLVPLIQSAVQQLFDDLPDTAKSPPLQPQGDTAKMPVVTDEELDISRTEEPKTPENATKLEFILSDDAAIHKFHEEVSDKGRQTSTEDIAMDIFRRLAAEEPPMPALEDSGTLRDFRAVLDTSDPKAVSTMLDDVEEPAVTDKPIVKPPTTKASEVIPAQIILSAALDDTTPLDAFSIDDLFLTIDQQLANNPLGIQPLPSWREQEKRFIREPDFLPENLPENLSEEVSGPLSATSEYSASTTQASKSEAISDKPDELQTENITPTQRSRPIQPKDLAPPAPPTLPEAIKHEPTLDSQSIRPEFEYTASFPPLNAEALSASEADEHTADFERIAPPPESEMIASEATSTSPLKPPTDPRIAQMAVTLTQASLELTAEATLLADGRQIIAYAGKMPFEDIEELRDTLEDDWSSEPGQSRIRFVTLPSSGRDYMVFSRYSADGLTLAMIFAGTMPLRVIRKQSNRLLEALTATSPAASPTPIETPVEPVIETPPLPPIDVGPLTGYTFVWLIADESRPLSDEAMQNILTGLDVYLTEKGWRIGELNVYEDYVYLQADVPEELSSHQVLRDLLKRSADLVATAQPEQPSDRLWASSYLILTPPRDLTAEEIQEFIAFARS